LVLLLLLLLLPLLLLPPLLLLLLMVMMSSVMIMLVERQFQYACSVLLDMSQATTCLGLLEQAQSARQ
jgi:hypothetical protein